MIDLSFGNRIKKIRDKLNRAAKGGGKYYPLPDFQKHLKTVADNDVKVSVPDPASIWRLPKK